MTRVSSSLGERTPAIMSAISLPRFPLPSMRGTMRATTPGQRAASCMAGLGRFWHCTQYAIVSRAPRESGSGSCAASKVGGRMRSSSGPCGLSAQRLRALSISSALARKTSSSALKSMGSIAPCESHQRCRDPLADRQHLEELAHLRGREELLRLRRDGCVDEGVFDIRLAQHVGDAAVDQELRLRRVAEQLGARRPRRAGEGAEVDVRGDVLVARPRERIGVRAMTVVAHQRPGGALRMVVLLPRKTVVDDEDETVLEMLAEGTHPVARSELDLAFVGRRNTNTHRFFLQPAGRPSLGPSE